jgi:hypothetical protein
MTITIVAVLLFSFGCKKTEKPVPQVPEVNAAPQVQTDANAK